MTPTRIIPDLQCSLLCEEIRQEINGNPLLIGVISHLRVPQLPVFIARLCLFNRWTAGHGQFTETVRMIAPDQATVLAKIENRFALKDVTHNFTTANVLGQLKLETAGVYYFEIMVDDIMKLRFPFQLVHTPPAEAPPPASPAGA